MICSICKKGETSVVDSRPTEDGTAIRRRRLCVCGARFTTFESPVLQVQSLSKNCVCTLHSTLMQWFTKINHRVRWVNSIADYV